MLRVKEGNGGVLQCIHMDTSVKIVNEFCAVSDDINVDAVIKVFACLVCVDFFFFQAEDGIRDVAVTGVQTCALPILTFAVVVFRVLCPVPQADAKSLASRCDKRDFVQESLLFPKKGNDFPFQSLGELRNAALQMHSDFACKHVNLLGWLTKGDSDNLLWYRHSESALSSLTTVG